MTRSAVNRIVHLVVFGAGCSHHIPLEKAVVEHYRLTLGVQVASVVCKHVANINADPASGSVSVYIDDAVAEDTTQWFRSEKMNEPNEFGNIEVGVGPRARPLFSTVCTREGLPLRATFGDRLFVWAGGTRWTVQSRRDNSNRLEFLALRTDVQFYSSRSCAAGWGYQPHVRGCGRFLFRSSRGAILSSRQPLTQPVFNTNQPQTQNTT